MLWTLGAVTGAELAAAEPALPFMVQFHVLELCIPACRRRSQCGSCAGCVGCHTKAGSHPGRTLQEQQQGHCCRIAPRPCHPRVRVVASVPEGAWGRALTCVCVPWAAGKHTASSHRLSALVTPAGRSYECQAQQTISLVSSDHQKSVQLLLSEVRIQPFDIPADFVFSEGKERAEAHPASPRC